MEKSKIMRFFGWLYAERNDYRGVHVEPKCTILKWLRR